MTLKLPAGNRSGTLLSFYSRHKVHRFQEAHCKEVGSLLFLGWPALSLFKESVSSISRQHVQESRTVPSSRCRFLQLDLVQVLLGVSFPLPWLLVRGQASSVPGTPAHTWSSSCCHHLSLERLGLQNGRERMECSATQTR